MRRSMPPVLPWLTGVLLFLAQPGFADPLDMLGYRLGQPESSLVQATKLREHNGITYYRAPGAPNPSWQLAGVALMDVQLAFAAQRLVQIIGSTTPLRPPEGHYCFEMDAAMAMETALTEQFGAPVVQALTASGPEPFYRLADEYGACRAWRDDVYDCELSLFQRGAAPAQQEALLNVMVLGEPSQDDADDACLLQVIYRQ